MNKIKILYDVVSTMKKKNEFKGELKVQGMKDTKNTFSFENAFERNNLTGKTKAKINTEVDCEEKKLKMESSIDSEIPGCSGLHGFMKHIHSHGGGVHRGLHSGGFSEGMGRIMFILGILNSLKAEEREDKSVALSLESADIPEELKNAIHEHMKKAGEEHGEMHGGNGHHQFMKDLHSMDSKNFRLVINVNKNSEIEKISLEVKGEGTDEKKERHDMKLSAELALAW